MTVDGLEDLPRTRPLYRRECEALGQQGFFADEDVEPLPTYRDAHPTTASLVMVRALHHPRVVVDVRALLR